MALKRSVVWTLVLLVAAAVPVSAAPAGVDCGMPAMSMAQSAPCCPPGACGCKIQSSAVRDVLAEAPAAAPVLFLAGALMNLGAFEFSKPAFAPPAPAASSPSPPHRKLYDLYSVYRL